MKAFYFVLCLVAASTAHAASLSFTWNNNAASAFLNGQSENGTFNAIVFKATMSPPLTFTNKNSGLATGIPRPPGQPFTYFNRMLHADPLDYPEGLGLVVLGTVNTPTELSFVAGSLGGTITTANQSGGNLFLANLNLSDLRGYGCLFNVTVQLYSDDVLVSEVQDRFLCPEPATSATAVSSLLALSFIRRRRRGPLPSRA